jgi:mannose-1-phosphate guanylyltransferase
MNAGFCCVSSSFSRRARASISKRISRLIICGGAGTRLWPASREVRPKQFLPLFGARSTFQDTLLRVSDESLFDRAIVITNAAYRFLVLEQLAEIGIQADVLLEPARRDSGPAIAAGAAFAQLRDKDAVVLALAADHVVQEAPAFLAACHQGLVAAEGGRIVRSSRSAPPPSMATSTPAMSCPARSARASRAAAAGALYHAPGPI